MTFLSAGIIGQDPTPSVTVLEDFEGADPLAKYSELSAGEFELDTTTPLAGTTSLRAASAFADTATADIPTPRGYEYRFLVRLEAATWGGPLLAVQDVTNPTADCYWFRMDQDASRVVLREHTSAGDSTAGALTGVPFTAGDTYELRVQHTATGVSFGAYDSQGAQLGTRSTSTTTHQGGFLGWNVRDAGPTFDQAEQHPLP